MDQFYGESTGKVHPEKLVQLLPKIYPKEAIIVAQSIHSSIHAKAKIPLILLYISILETPLYYNLNSPLRSPNFRSLAMHYFLPTLWNYR